MTFLELQSHRRCELIDITAKVQEVVRQSGVQHGMVVVFALHTTAAITLNENADADVVRDLLVHLERLSPEQGDYLHDEGNSDAHLKSSLIGASETLLLDAGQLQLGTWQGLYFCEFDGPRSRRVGIGVVSA